MVSHCHHQGWKQFLTKPVLTTGTTLLALPPAQTHQHQRQPRLYPPPPALHVDASFFLLVAFLVEALCDTMASCAPCSCRFGISGCRPSAPPPRLKASLPRGQALQHYCQQSCKFSRITAIVRGHGWPSCCCCCHGCCCCCCCSTPLPSVPLLYHSTAAQILEA
jgi:hypothetical protein